MTAAVVSDDVPVAGAQRLSDDNMERTYSPQQPPYPTALVPFMGVRTTDVSQGLSVGLSPRIVPADEKPWRDTFSCA